VAISIVGIILLGAFLSQFCRVFVFLPASALVLAVEFGKAFYFGLEFWRSLFEFALMSTSLQIGYVAVPAFCTLFNLPRRVRLKRRQARAESMASTASMRRH
jgi:hypothetical protein